MSTMDIGPLRFYRVPKTGSLCVSVKYFDDFAFGWEYGYDDRLCERRPWLSLRMGKLMLFSFECWKDGFEIWLLGFWWIV